MLEVQLSYRVEAHKCGLGTLAIRTLVTLESGPNSTGLSQDCEGTFSGLESDAAPEEVLKLL